MLRNPSQSTNNSEPIETFFRRWLIDQEQILQELLQSTTQCNGNYQFREEDQRGLKQLIDRVTSHYNQYYLAKSMEAQNNIFVLFSAPWLTPFESTFQWITGFKPGLALGLIRNSVSDLNDDQSQAIELLKAETKVKERRLDEELARVQETVAAPPIMQLARRAARPVDGELVALDSAIEMLSSAMEAVVKSADNLRFETVRKIMEILNSSQIVRFLTSVAQFHLMIRSRGLEIDTARTVD